MPSLWRWIGHNERTIACVKLPGANPLVLRRAGTALAHSQRKRSSGAPHMEDIMRKSARVIVIAFSGGILL
jgi:hypothetical protein